MYMRHDKVTLAFNNKFLCKALHYRDSAHHVLVHPRSLPLTANRHLRRCFLSVPMLSHMKQNVLINPAPL